MPTLLNWKGHKFFFYSKEIGEPPHVHVLKDGKQAKVWLKDKRVARSIGFADHELNAILKETKKHQNDFIKAWNDYFGN